MLNLCTQSFVQINAITTNYLDHIYPGHITSNSIKITKFKRKFICKSKPNSPEERKQTDKSKSLKTNNKIQKYRDFFTQVGINAGLAGTAAVILGRFLHVDPFGHFSLNSISITVGLLCALPSLLFETSIWLAPIPEKSFVLSEDSIVDFDTIIKLTIKKYKTMALAYFSDVDVYTDAIMRLLLSIGSQMLYTALLFTVVSGWVRDRLLEGGLDDDFFAYGFSCDEASKFIIFTLICSTHVYELIRILKVSTEIVYDRGDQNSRNNDFVRIAENMSKVELLGSIVGSFVGLLNEIATCLPFIVTGNLASSIVGSFSQSILQSAFMRANYINVIEEKEDLKVVNNEKVESLMKQLYKAIRLSEKETITTKEREEYNNSISVDITVLLKIMRAELEKLRQITLLSKEENVKMQPGTLDMIKEKEKEMLDLVARAEAVIAKMNMLSEDNSKTKINFLRKNNDNDLNNQE